MPTKAPNQDKNAGNRGDVWKHRTLLLFANLLLDNRDPKQPFRYFESHSGKGVYNLAESKGADQGIQEASHRLGPNDPYIVAERGAVASGEYLGSWKLIARMLTERGFAGQFQLCDTDERVLQAARSRVEEQHEFDFHQGDGFAAARTADADLYLIDPFDSWAQSASLATALAHRNVLVWYGIAANGKPNELVQQTGLIGFDVLWSQIHPNHSPTQRGCGLLLSKPLQALLPNLIRDSLEASWQLGWQLHLRVPWEVA